jgi:hypothetical protein
MPDGGIQAQHLIQQAFQTLIDGKHLYQHITIDFSPYVVPQSQKQVAAQRICRGV